MAGRTSEAEKPRPDALARWDNEGGAVACGPQVPGVARDCGEDEAPRADRAKQAGGLPGGTQ